ncbi:uncharacterized protein M421DRAFT_160518 [Didymella exigua CBS 183.55]|uniref:Uncharacterized protein n=1 Tax=Didymella exigua CBS 183.55 TaxID=1150837 RepID=A0A6A5RKV4_9PLEO|nr:uncharacterized protein M421DRAFT_160518 [Didymella exigua CBS 183.55]KAF1928422.1 hypothetical protein M421DRAFT_160518 [Didymella exigua CBS 183.55]
MPAGPHRYNYARLCCSAGMSFVVCALCTLRHHPSLQVPTSVTTQVLTSYTPPDSTCCIEMQSRSACRNPFDFIINSRGALQLLLACVQERAPTLADNTTLVIEPTHYDSGDWLALSLASDVIDIGRVRSARNRVIPQPLGFDNGHFVLQLNGAQVDVRHQHLELWVFAIYHCLVVVSTISFVFS